MPETRRLFAGIALDESARAICTAAGEALRRTGFEARYEGAEKLHVTLAFLGNVEAEKYDAIVAAMEAAAAATEPFSLRLDKVSAFPNERKPRIVFVGSRDQGGGYRELSARLREAYADMGFTFKEDSVAHVTIARVKESRRALPLIEPQAAELRVDTLALFESIFDKERNTTRYEIGARAMLHTARKGATI